MMMSPGPEMLATGRAGGREGGERKEGGKGGREGRERREGKERKGEKEEGKKEATLFRVTQQEAM